MGDEQSNKHRVEALKTALKSQRSEALQREEALQSQLTGLWNWADKERKTLVRQVSELRSQLGAAQGVNTPSPPPSAASLSRILSTDTPQALRHPPGPIWTDSGSDSMLVPVQIWRTG
jgi:hypothetical protein